MNIALFGDMELLDYVPWAISFEVVGGDFYGTERESGDNQLVYVKRQWQVQ